MTITTISARIVQWLCRLQLLAAGIKTDLILKELNANWCNLKRICRNGFRRSAVVHLINSLGRLPTTVLLHVAFTLHAAGIKVFSRTLMVIPCARAFAPKFQKKKLHSIPVLTKIEAYLRADRIHALVVLAIAVWILVSAAPNEPETCLAEFRFRTGGVGVHLQGAYSQVTLCLLVVRHIPHELLCTDLSALHLR